MADTSPADVGQAIWKLRQFPAMQSREIAAYLGISAEAMRQAAARHRRDLPESQRAADARHQDPSDNARPSEAEMRWRFENQSSVAIIERFGHLTAAFIHELGLLDDCPAMLRDRLVQQGWMTPEGAVPDGCTVALGDSGLSVKCNSPDVATYIKGMFLIYDDQYIVPPTGYTLIKSRLDMLRVLKEKWDDASNTPDGYSKLSQVQRQTENGEFQFPLRRSRDAAAAVQQALEDAPAYIAEHGWKDTVSCGLCGTQVNYYLVAYASMVEIWQWARQLLMGISSPEEALAAARTVHTRFVEHPLLARECRDVGTAWSAPLLEELFAIMEDELEQRARIAPLLPEGTDYEPIVTMAAIKRVGMRVLNVGPAAFDERVPISAIHRVKVVNGKVRVLEAKV